MASSDQMIQNDNDQRGLDLKTIDTLIQFNVFFSGQILYADSACTNERHDFVTRCVCLELDDSNRDIEDLISENIVGNEEEFYF